MRVEAVNSGVHDDLLGVCVRSASDAVVVGRGGVILRWDGSRWAREPCPTEEDLYSVCATPEGEIVAVGGNLKVGGHSLVCRFAAGGWTVERSPVQSVLLSVAAAPGCVRAVGFNGDLVERVDGAWRVLEVPTNAHLFCIRAFGASWLACGLDGTLVALEGVDARLHQAGRAHLTCVTGSDATRFAVGFEGTILRLDTGNWQRVPSPAREHLWGAVCDGTRLIVAGARGSLLAGGGDALALLSVPTREDLHAVDGGRGFSVAVGRRGTIVHLHG